MPEIPVEVPSEGYGLPGILHIPEGRARSPGVLFLHGFTGNKSEAGRLYVDMARELCRMGYVCLRFDYRGHGDAPLPFEEFSIRLAVEDALNAARYLSGRPEVNSAKIGLIGLSMGGGVAVKVAATLENVGAVVLLAPALYWPQLARGMAGVKPEEGYIYMGALRLKVENAIEMTQFSVIELAPEIKAPTLIIHATDDNVVPISQSRKFIEGLNVEKRLLEVSGGHVFNDYKVREMITGEIKKWLASHLPLE